MATALAGGGLPAWSGLTTGAAGIQSQASDSHENVSLPDVEGDPISLAFFAILKEFPRSDAALDEPSFSEDVGNGARAIVARIAQPSMTATPFVRHLLKPVPRCDGALDRCGRPFRSIGNAIFDQSRAAVFEMIDDWTLRLHLAGAGDQPTGRDEEGEENEGENSHVVNFQKISRNANYLANSPSRNATTWARARERWLRVFLISAGSSAKVSV
jgi:hypothetical protein